MAKTGDRIAVVNPLRYGLLRGGAAHNPAYVDYPRLVLTDVNYKRNLDIVQQDRDGTSLRL